jgi:hypothetical protein
MVNQKPTSGDECQTAYKAANPVAAENTCPGTASWRPADHATGPQEAIEGFTNPVSVNVGQSVHIYVSTTAPSYFLQVYRMGWYQGLGGRLLYSLPDVPGIRQPAPTLDPATRMVSCSNWHDPLTLEIPDSWVSGIYLVKLVSSQGYIRYTSFIVRNDASHAPILYQSSVLTYQAYNLWGGYSLYFGSQGNQYTRTARSYVVSFDRPYSDNDGLMDYVLYEYNMVRWLEQRGYNLSYAADLDNQLHPETLLNHRLILVSGHDEYWSTPMRDNITAARDAGVSLAFFGGNDVWWHIRLQSSPLGPGREVVCYRVASLDPETAVNPKEATVNWRDAPLNQPENALLGEGYSGIVAEPAPLVLSAGAAPFLKGTTLNVGSALPGLEAGEFDGVLQNNFTPSSLIVLATSPVKCNSGLCTDHKGVANATVYTAPSGAKVFDAGTFQWQWGLDNDTFDGTIPQRSYSNPDFQLFTEHLLAYLLSTSTTNSYHFFSEA